jgi:hypothetical protein
LQIFLGKEHLVKNWLISTLYKLIYFKWTIFLRSTKPLFTTQNRVDTSWKKFSRFFQHACSMYVDLRFLWSTYVCLLFKASCYCMYICMWCANPWRYYFNVIRNVGMQLKT